MRIRHLYALAYPWFPFVGGVATLVVAFALRFVPEFTDSVYRNTLFAGLRWLIDSTLGWLPFPVFWLVLCILFALILRGWLRRTLFLYRPWYRGIANALGWLMVVFHFSWGFNYSAPGFIEKSGIQIPTDSGDFRSELLGLALNQAVMARENADTTLFFSFDQPRHLMEAIHAEVRSVLALGNFQTPGKPRMRLVRGGVLRRIGISGIYFPFSGECHTDATYLPLRRYPIAAHEFAHAYGITDEGECNLIGFLALARSRNASFRYAAWLDLIATLLPELDALPKAIRTDLEQLRADAKNYPPLIPGLAEFSNNLYLKANGVEDGIHNYARTPVLVHAALEVGWVPTY